MGSASDIGAIISYALGFILASIVGLFFFWRVKKNKKIRFGVSNKEKGSSSKHGRNIYIKIWKPP
jgi:hypothetical protein